MKINEMLSSSKISQLRQKLIRSIQSKKYAQAEAIIKDDLTSEKWSDIFFYLSKKIPKPELVAFLNSMKNAIVRHMLFSFKEEWRFEVKLMLITLRNIGITWPELDVIEKSYNASMVAEEVSGNLDASSDAEQISAVKDDKNAIHRIKNPSEAVQLAALDVWGNEMIKYLRHPTEAVQLAAVKENGQLLYYIKNPASKRVIITGILKAIKDNNFKLIRDLYQYYRDENPSWPEWGVIDNSLESDRQIYEETYINDLPEEELVAGVEKDPHLLKYIKNPSEAIQLAAVKANGFVIHYIQNPSEAVQLTAIKESPFALIAIKNPASKAVILTGLLGWIKSGTFENREFDGVYTKYHDLYPNWPEWAIIDRALESSEQIDENVVATRDNYEQLIHQLLDAIRDHDEKTASEIFLAMSRFWMLSQVVEYIWSYADDRSHASWFFELQKRAIVSFILEEIKDDPSETFIPKLVVKIMRKAGMDWPELDIIQKSLNADKKVTESYNSQSDWRELVDAVQQQNWSAVKGQIVYLINNGYSLSDIVNELAISLDNVDFEVFAEKYKSRIIRELLLYIKNDELEDALNMVEGLKTGNITWPELKAVKRSLQADKKLSETWTVNAQSHSKISRILIKKIEDRDTEDLTELFLAMSRYLMMHQVLAHVLHYVLNPKSAVWFFNLQKKPIMMYLLGELKEGEDCEIDLITGVLDVLDEAKIKWPELDIIKRSLRADHKLKEEKSNKYDYEIQHTLEEIDIQLSNRQASFVTWVHRLKHYGALSRVIPLIKKYKKNVIKIAETKIRQGAILTFLEIKQILDEAGAHIPELDTIIEDNKDTIIKLILEKMKKGRVAVAGSDLRILYKIGINWPELKIIQRSVDAENSNK